MGYQLRICAQGQTRARVVLHGPRRHAMIARPCTATSTLVRRPHRTEGSALHIVFPHCLVRIGCSASRMQRVLDAARLGRDTSGACVAPRCWGSTARIGRSGDPATRLSSSAVDELMDRAKVLPLALHSPPVPHNPNNWPAIFALTTAVDGAVAGVGVEVGKRSEEGRERHSGGKRHIKRRQPRRLRRPAPHPPHPRPLPSQRKHSNNNSTAGNLGCHP